MSPAGHAGAHPRGREPAPLPQEAQPAPRV